MLDFVHEPYWNKDELKMEKTDFKEIIDRLHEERKAYLALASQNQAQATEILKKIRKLEAEKKRQEKRLNDILKPG